MTDECISPLRRRMIEDMTVRNFVVKTQTDYIRRVESFHAVYANLAPGGRIAGGFFVPAPSLTRARRCPISPK
jgi:hypothetical protein